MSGVVSAAPGIMIKKSLLVLNQCLTFQSKIYDKIRVECPVDCNDIILYQITSQRGHRATTYTENSTEGPVFLVICVGKCP